MHEADDIIRNSKLFRFIKGKKAYYDALPQLYGWWVFYNVRWVSWIKTVIRNGSVKIALIAVTTEFSTSFTQLIEELPEDFYMKKETCVISIFGRC